jgi:hypothetical protein
MAADLLRKAAAKLREMAEGTTGAPWLAVDGTMYPRWILGTPDKPDYAPDVAKVYSDDEDALQVSDADWKWMAFANPALAGPLADLLDHCAKNREAAEKGAAFVSDESGQITADQIDPLTPYAMRVARVILGEVPAGE